MYGVSFPMTDAEMKDDFLIPLGKARVDRVGTDITLVAHSKAVGTCLEAAEVRCALVGFVSLYDSGLVRPVPGVSWVCCVMLLESGLVLVP